MTGQTEKPRKRTGLSFRFLLFLSLAVVLNLLFRMPAATGFSWFLIGLTARTSAWLINLVGIEARLSGDVIGLSNQSLLINAECTAIYLMIFFGSFVTVYPARWISKMVGLVAGIPVIFGANVFRLLLTAYVVEFRPGYFQYFHDYMWQVAFIIFVIVLWWLWIELVAKYDARDVLAG